jgi:hypothetical protein
MFWWWDDVIARLTRIESKLNTLIAKEIREMATIDDIKAAVTAEDTVVASAVTLLQQLATQLQTAINANDPTALQAVVDDINANAKSLGDAVAANTPAAPAPAPPA